MSLFPKKWSIPLKHSVSFNSINIMLRIHLNSFSGFLQPQ